MEESVIQNLRDAGCSQTTISRFMECLKNGAEKEELQILSRHRKTLLDRIHREERKIDCLDYLVYQIEQHKITIERGAEV